jgi:hypothetical protein
MSSYVRPSPGAIATATAVAVVIALGLADLGAAPRDDGQGRATAKPARRISTAAKCSSDLGVGVTGRRRYCDVLVAKTGAASISMAIPPHTGAATLMFDLHNRFTVPPKGVEPADAFVRAAAVVAVVRPMGQVIDRAAVRREYRTTEDLFDRLAGGSPPTGYKAVAPGFPEAVRITIPAGVESVGIVGVRLEFATRAGRGTAEAPQRPIAIVSNLRIDYLPAR